MGNRKESTGNVTILVVVEGTCDTLQTGGPHDISVIFVWSRVENIVEIDKVSTLRMGIMEMGWKSLLKFARFYTWKFCTCTSMVSYIGTDKGMTNL